MDKKQVRAEIRQLKKSISEEKRNTISRIICEKVYDLLKDYPPCKVALFLSMPDEVDTAYLIDLLSQSGKHTLLVPRVEDATTINFYPLSNIENYNISDLGIKEPNDDSSLAQVPNVMIVPGVAFDTLGGRVGRGRGYYDRYINRYNDDIKELIAIGYQLQVTSEEVPMDTLDKRMHRLFTEENSYIF